MSGGTPREVLDNVQDADWAADGQNMAVVRRVPENHHWRLEYPIGHVLLDSINWISHPKISPDGKWLAFADHENPGGDDEGSLAVVDMQGHEKKLSSGWVSLQGVVWAPSGDEIWFTATKSGSANNLHGVTLSGKLRTITNVPGGMWLEDIRNGALLTITHQQRIGIRGMPPDGKEEHELGWFGWSILRDISRDGKKIIFDEEGEGGGPGYTVYLRDTDGSPPARIGDGSGKAISPDGKWVITKPQKEGAMWVVPTGAGEARQLTHDNISYGSVRYLPDGKQLLASGIEPGRGARDYLIDLNTGTSKPLTPEGVVGTILAPDGRNVVVRGTDGKLAVWPMDGSSTHPIPALESKFNAIGWAPDGTSLYVTSGLQRERTAHIYRVNITTGKMDPWKTFGDTIPAGVSAVAAPTFSKDSSAYAYVYVQILSQAYVVRGLK
jgi:eukaryotic-like serine/threonine-protein kinase